MAKKTWDLEKTRKTIDESCETVLEYKQANPEENLDNFCTGMLQGYHAIDVILSDNFSASKLVIIAAVKKEVALISAMYTGGNLPIDYLAGKKSAFVQFLMTF
jgi:branched-subunit amino acid permease